MRFNTKSFLCKLYLIVGIQKDKELSLCKCKRFFLANNNHSQNTKQCPYDKVMDEKKSKKKNNNNNNQQDLSNLSQHFGHNEFAIKNMYTKNPPKTI